MNPAIMLSLTLGLSLTMLQPIRVKAHAATQRLDAFMQSTGAPMSLSRGGNTRLGAICPHFTAVAKSSSTTGLSLKAFLRSNHLRMPDFVLKPTEADNIVAYILSLRRK